ncbi:hypothetical protein KP509_1Z250000 [Ceratopteris richardii]|nr:hypothetical protein KP509_1Z250000 [Ceratopteris richardii]
MTWPSTSSRRSAEGASLSLHMDRLGRIPESLSLSWLLEIWFKTCAHRLKDGGDHAASDQGAKMEGVSIGHEVCALQSVWHISTELKTDIENLFILQLCHHLLRCSNQSRECTVT